MDDVEGIEHAAHGRRPWARIAVAVAAVVAVAVLAGIAVVVLTDGGNPTVIEAPSPVDDPSGSEAGGAPDEVAGAGAGAFPSVRSRDLNGDPVMLPDDLPGTATAVLLSWARADQDGVDAWVSALAPLEAAHDGLDHVQLAITGDSSAVTRTTVTFFMRQAMPDEPTRARTIPLFTDFAVLTDLLDVPSDQGVGVLLVDDGGQILWRHVGEVGAQAVADLRAHLDPT